MFRCSQLVSGRRRHAWQAARFSRSAPDGPDSEQTGSFEHQLARLTAARSARANCRSSATHTATDHRRAGAVQLERCLCDVNVFRALRARGQARGGAEGVADLIAALGLVNGVPFSQPPGSFAWVFEGERLDHIMTIAILELASIVISRALANGDVATAPFAAETAHRATPDDDQAKLDLVAIAVSEGHGGTAASQILDGLAVASEDCQSPVDLSVRTKTIVERLRSASRGSA